MPDMDIEESRAHTEALRVAWDEATARVQAIYAAEEEDPDHFTIGDAEDQADLREEATEAEANYLRARVNLAEKVIEEIVRLYTDIMVMVGGPEVQLQTIAETIEEGGYA